MTRKPPLPPSDAWYESEVPTRVTLIRELQRIAFRTRARPLRVIALAAVLTGAIGYKIATKKPLVEAETVLLLTQGQMAEKTDVAPVTVEQLREYVQTVLLPDDKLLALIKKRDLYKIRATMGDQFAIGELREQIEIETWKNTFVYYDEDIANPEHSARIGLTVADTDPDRAILLSRELAEIVVDTASEHQRSIADVLTLQIRQLREGLARRLEELSNDHALRVTQLVTAQRDGHPGAAAGLTVVLAEIEHQQEKLELEQAGVLRSRDAVADQIAQAGLDMRIEIVDEHHPERNDHGSFVLIMVCVVVGVGALLGSALVFGAFDARLHDLEDLTRLGLPVLGHVPGFPGDDVGSLETRGALRRRVPSFLRWRSQR